MKHLSPLFLLLFLFSCSGENDAPVRKPGYSGKSGEVLIVMDRELIGTELEEVLTRAFSVPFERNPQREARTAARTVAREDMASYSKLHRNLVVVELGRQSKKVSISRDVWSNGQVVLRLLAPDHGTAVEVAEQNATQMLDIVIQEERSRTIVRLGAHRNTPLEDRIQNKHGVRFIVPLEYKIRGSEKHFTWLEVDRVKFKNGRDHHALQGLIIYDRPFTNDSLLQSAVLHAYRDSMLKKNLPGPSDDSYMGTQYKFREIDLSPLVYETTHKGMYAVFQKGLWKMHNAFMGGPYVSMTQVDSIAGRIVTVEGYVYSPEFPKREFLREMDAIVHSFEIPEKVKP